MGAWRSASRADVPAAVASSTLPRSGLVQQRELSALAPKKRGPKGKPVDPREQEMAGLRRQLAVANARAERAELIVEIQKKLSIILGIELPKIPEDR